MTYLTKLKIYLLRCEKRHDCFEDHSISLFSVVTKHSVTSGLSSRDFYIQHYI